MLVANRVMELLAKRYLFSWLIVASSLQVSSIHFAQASILCTAYLNVSFVDPENNETVWRVRQEEIGLYGQDSGKVTVSGDVYVPDPIYSCETDTSYEVPSESKGWIALIQRGHGCTFSKKINFAASKGAIGAVIFNDLGTDRVIPMSHPGTGGMVAIMIGHALGVELAHLIKKGCPVTMNIEMGKKLGPWMNHTSVIFVTISFFVVTTAIFGFFVFYSARRLNVRLRKNKQKQLKAEAKKAIGQLQVRTLKQGDQETGPDADTCAVCIDAYKPGDVLSILTCNHLFHKTCIEPWLLEHRTCPMCKCDILKALGVEHPDIEESSHQTPTPSDIQSYPVVLDDARSETASSGYASVQSAEGQGSPTEFIQTFNDNQAVPDPGAIHIEITSHYDNLAFMGESQNSR